MAISYPLNMPSGLKESSARLFAANSVSSTVSPFTFQSQIYQHGGEAWGLEVSLDPMPRAEAAPWIAFLGALRGKFGTFLYGPELLKNPMGLAAGTPRVNGANQTGSALITDGWTAGTTLKAGDLFQISTSLYMALTDQTADGSGNMTIDVWPRLRVHADNLTLTLSSPRGIFRLSENVASIVDTPRHGLFEISFTAEEAL